MGGKLAEDQFTGVTRAKFIATLAEFGVVTIAATKAGVATRTAYKLRERDAEFAKDWDDALRDSADVLEAEARRRGVEGWKEPAIGGKGLIVHNGKVVNIRKFDGRLLELLLKGRRPEVFAKPDLGTLPRPADLAPDPEPTPDEPGPANPKI